MTGATGASGPIQTQVSKQTDDQPWQAWLGTPEARGYDGEWVLLSAEARPIDSDRSPTTLAQRHSAGSGQVIVFVEPAG